MRLFVGLALPKDIRDRLRMLSGGLAGARWVKPENLHLSLRFIGEVPGGEERDIFEALRGIEAPAFDLMLSGLGSFERRGRVHAVWAGVEKSDGLSHLQSKVAAALVRTGFLGPAVGGLADVPAAGAGGIDDDVAFQAFFFDKALEDTFRGRRAADVSEAHEQNLDQRFPPPDGALQACWIIMAHRPLGKWALKRIL